MKFPTLPGFDQQAFDKYLKNTGWLMLGKILGMLVTFAVAKFLGANRLGDLKTAEAVIVIVSAVSMLGLDSFVVREIIHEPGKRDEILGSALRLRLLASLLLIPLTIGGYALYRSWSSNPPGTVVLSMVAILSFTSIFKAFNVIDSYFQSQVESKYVVKVQNVCLFISSALKIILILLGAPVILFAWALLFDAFILAAGLIFIYSKRVSGIFSWSVDRVRARRLLDQSWPLIISAVMVSLYMKIDIVMLQSAWGSAEVGIYSAAANFSEAWYFIPVAVVTSVFPAIINARKTDAARYQKRLQNLYDLLVAISLPAAIAISFSADFIIHAIYKNIFPGAGLMLSIHIWSGIFVFLGIASSQYLLAEGYTRISFIRTGLGALVNIGLNLWLIPAYGGVGASVATFIACVVATFSALFFRQARSQGILMLKSLFLISPIQTILNRSNR